MKIEVGSVYADKNVPGVRGRVVILSADDGMTEFAPKGGGCVERCPVTQFMERFEAVDEASDRSTFERIHVEIEGRRGSLAAWSDGNAWMGFEVPFFEMDAVEAGIANGTFDNETIHAEVLNDGVFIAETLHGSTLPPTPDWGRIIDALRSDSNQEEFELAPGVSVCAYVFQPTLIEAGGREVEVVSFGSGWRWVRTHHLEEDMKP